AARRMGPRRVACPPLVSHARLRRAGSWKNAASSPDVRLRLGRDGWGGRGAAIFSGAALLAPLPPWPVPEPNAGRRPPASERAAEAHDPIATRFRSHSRSL
ncbi:MAG: hypothetical protein AVDCRST_MAG73-683, partial [uncultured Thermomicrobiales bacterium]